MKHESSWPVGGLVHTSTYPIVKGGSLSPKEQSQEAKADHSPKWQDCVHDVQKKGGDVDPYAVCTTSVGHQSECMQGGTLSPQHKKECDSSSSNPQVLRDQTK
jgi:hypothetical protein